MNLSCFKKAVPIWLKTDMDEMNLRVVFQVNSKICSDTKICIATSCVYNLYIDGEFLAYGPARAGRNTFRMDVIELGTFETKDCLITIEVQSYQVNSFYIMHQAPFLQAEIISEGKVTAFTGDNAFRLSVDSSLVQKVQRFSFQRPFVEAYRLEETSYDYRTKGLQKSLEHVTLEERKIIERIAPYPEYELLESKAVCEGKAYRIKKPKYEDSRSYTGICDKLKGFLPEELEWHVSREIQDFAFENTTLNDNTLLRDEEYRIYELPYNSAGFPQVQVRVEKDTELYLIFDEVLVEEDICMTRDECCRAVKYELKPGNYNLKFFEVYGMKYIKVFVKKGVSSVEKVEFITYLHPQVKYIWADANEDCKTLISAAENTYRANAVDLFTDCPSRERGGYPCDSFFTGRVEYLLTGKNHVEKSFLQNFLHEDSYECIDEGMIPMCYPADHLDGVYIPNWGLWLILELKEYLQRTGDREFIDEYRNKVYGILEFHKKLENDEYLLTNIPEGVFVEWSHANEMVQDINFPSNMLYCEALKTVARLYGDEKLIGHAEKIKKSIVKHSYNGKFFCDHAKIKDGKICTVNESSEVCQYYAFCFGIANKDSFPELFNCMISDFTEKRQTENAYPGICFAEPFIGIPLRMEMLLKYGRFADAYREIMAYYLPQAKTTGTLWECRTLCSCNHGVSSIVLYWLDEIRKQETYQVLGTQEE